MAPKKAARQDRNASRPAGFPTEDPPATESGGDASEGADSDIDTPSDVSPPEDPEDAVAEQADDGATVETTPAPPPGALDPDEAGISPHERKRRRMEILSGRAKVASEVRQRTEASLNTVVPLKPYHKKKLRMEILSGRLKNPTKAQMEMAGIPASARPSQ